MKLQVTSPTHLEAAGLLMSRPMPPYGVDERATHLWYVERNLIASFLIAKEEIEAVTHSLGKFMKDKER